MKNRAIICICLIVTLLFGICIGAGAAGGLETISAYLTYNTKVKLDGQLQNLYDGNGKQVYPINYQGTTYLPIRAISNLLGIDVGWDGATKTVLLGKTGEAKDFIEDLKPYSEDGVWRYTSEDNNPREIAGKTYTSYLRLGNPFDQTGEIYYDLGGQYKTLTFKLYTENSFEYAVTLYGDNNVVLKEITVVPHQLPTSISVDVSDVIQLTIAGYENIYLFDATIE